MTLQSSAVSAGDIIAATNHNELREDIVLNGGDSTGTVGGTANAITLSIDSVYTAYANGDKIVFKAGSNNTGATTINVNSLGVKTIKNVAGGDLLAKEIRSGQWVTIQYDGTNFLLTSCSILFSAKGDIIAGTADGARAILPVGGVNENIVTDSAESTGLVYTKRGGVILFKDSGVTLTSGTDGDLITTTVPANSLGIDGGVRVNLYIGDMDRASGNITFYLYFGATSCNITFTLGAMTNYRGWVTGTFMNNGSTSSQLSQLRVELNENDDAVNPVNYTSVTGGTAAIDTTSDVTFRVYVDWSATVSGNNITMTNGYIELLGIY